MPIHRIRMIMQNRKCFQSILLICLVCVTSSFAVDDYSDCVLKCLRVGNLSDPYFPEIELNDCNTSICRLRNESEKIFLGKIIKIHKAEKNVNPNNGLIAFAPLEGDASYDEKLKWEEMSDAKKYHFDIELQVNGLYDEKKQMWKIYNDVVKVSADIMEGRVWEGNPMILPYYRPVTWDDSLRMFFLKEDKSSLIVVGFSEPILFTDLKDMSLCGVGVALRERTNYCSSYNPYRYSESVLYEGNPSVDVKKAKKEGPPNVIVYGSVDSVLFSSLEITEEDDDKLRNPKTIESINPKLKKKYLDYLSKLMKYKVTYVISKKGRFDLLSKKWLPDIGKMRMSSIQYSGWTIDENSVLMVRNTIDSLRGDDYIFSGYKSKNGDIRLDYVSKRISKMPTENTHFQMWSRKIENKCYVKPLDIK